MTSSLDEREAEYYDSLKHAKRGGCIGAILLLIFVPLICYVIVTFTDSGKGVWANGVMTYTYYGIPITPQTYGFAQLAEYGCELDKTKPANYKDEHEQVAERYEANHDLYRENWETLNKLNWSTDFTSRPRISLKLLTRQKSPFACKESNLKFL